MPASLRIDTRFSGSACGDGDACDVYGGTLFSNGFHSAGLAR